MTDSWIEELERAGLAWRVRNAPDAAVTIVSSSTVEMLPPEEAASAVQRLLSGQIEGAVTRAGWRGQELFATDLLADAWTIAEALASGKLVAYRVAASSAITPGEAAAVEAMLNQNSVPAPGPNPNPGPAPEPLHPYPIKVLDDTNAPVPSVSMKLEIQGTPKMASTDGSGAASPEWFSKSDGTLRILNQATIEKQLQPRWQLPSSPLLPGGSGVYEVEVGQPFPDVTATADKKTVIIISRGDNWSNTNQQTQTQCMLDASQNGTPLVQQNESPQSSSGPQPTTA